MRVTISQHTHAPVTATLEVVALAAVGAATILGGTACRSNNQDTSTAQCELCYMVQVRVSLSLYASLSVCVNPYIHRLACYHWLW